MIADDATFQVGSKTTDSFELPGLIVPSNAGEPRKWATLSWSRYRFDETLRAELNDLFDRSAVEWNTDFSDAPGDDDFPLRAAGETELARIVPPYEAKFPVSCLLGMSGGLVASSFDVHNLGVLPAPWDQTFDGNLGNQSSLGGFTPDGLGLDIPTDGSSATIEVTDEGIYAVSFQMIGSQDADFKGFMGISALGLGSPFSAAGGVGLAGLYSQVLRMDFAFEFAFAIYVDTVPADPDYAPIVNAYISRLA